MTAEIGIMQGRLLPRYKGRYQAFPKGYWEAEFHIAKQLGFAQVEFILDYEDAEANPLLAANGIAEIRRVVECSGVAVRSICADYFMEAPFHSALQPGSEEILGRLIDTAQELKIKDIVIPCVDQSTLKDAADEAKLVQSLKKFARAAQGAGVMLNLETDLDPDRFKQLLRKIDDPNVKVNYDTGNSASLGYDPQREFEAYGEFISDLHIKDRKLGAASVELGTGDANFEVVFGLLKDYGFSGNIIMQAARAADYVDDLSLVRKQLNFAVDLVESYLDQS